MLKSAGGVALFKVGLAFRFHLRQKSFCTTLSENKLSLLVLVEKGSTTLLAVLNISSLLTEPLIWIRSASVRVLRRQRFQSAKHEMEQIDAL
jgi:hypothetical protein